MVAEIPQGTKSVCLQDGAINLGRLLPYVRPLKKYELQPPGECQPDSGEPIPEELIGLLPHVDPSVKEEKQVIKDAASFARM